MIKQFRASFSKNSQKLSEEKFQLDLGKSLLIGNVKGLADLKISSDSVSRKHLYIALDGRGDLLICDAGSSNGSFVGNRKLESNTWHALRSNEKISLGREVTCEITEENTTVRQPPPLPKSPKEGLDLGNDVEDDDDEDEPRININFKPKIQVPTQSNPTDKNPISLSGLIIVGALICAALTNPSKQDHLKAIEEKFPYNTSIIEQAKEDYLNLVVCSVVRINPQLASFGLFKNIIFVNPEKFDKKK